MAITQVFEYERPGSLGKALKILRKYGDGARVLAGGTDLITLIEEDLVAPEIVVDLKGIEDLGEIREKNGRIQIGALVTFSELQDSPLIQKHFPTMWEMTHWVASVGIRNRATMVGNICSAVPCCDSGPILLVHEAVVHVRSAAGKRKVSIADWFKGPRKTVLRKNEMVTGVSVPIVKGAHGGCFAKLRRYRGEDLAQASVTAMAFPNDTYRVAFGSVAPVPLRGSDIETLLSGKKLNSTLIEQAQKAAFEMIAPITDIRATKEYRAAMVKVMLERALRTAVLRLSGQGPKYGESVL